MDTSKMFRNVKVAIPVIFIVTMALFALLTFLILRVSQVRENGIEMVKLGNEMTHNNDELIKLMRVYTITQDKAVLSQYYNIINDYDSLDGKLDKMAKLGLDSTEKGYVDRLLGLLDDLAAIEDEAIKAIDNGDYASAESLIFGDKYFKLDEELGDLSHDLVDSIEERTSRQARILTIQGGVGLVAVVLFFTFTMFMLRYFINWFSTKMQEFEHKAFWYESLLNSVPLPLSVTDMDLKCTFINTAVEDMLGVKLKDVRGKHCGDIWKAGICRTQNCGVTCLQKGQDSTQFNQNGFDFKVNASYLLDEDQKRIGYIEVVQNITDMLKAQREQAELIEAIHQAAVVFTTDAKLIADGATHLADGATGQSATIEELSAAINEIKAKTIDNAGHAKEAAEMSSAIIVNAHKGSEKMDRMMQAVREIDESSKQIENVIKVIDSIASQTNLLSLNAAIEAARAGEAGRGFAVVAEEVRDLASKSAEAARNTGTLILSTVEKAQLGLEMASETAESLNEIVAGINKNAEIISDIAKSCELQVESIGYLNAGVDEVAHIAEQNSATAQESASTSMEMSDQAERLELLISGR